MNEFTKHPTGHPDTDAVHCGENRWRGTITTPIAYSSTFVTAAPRPVVLATPHESATRGVLGDKDMRRRCRDALRAGKVTVAGRIEGDPGHPGSRAGGSGVGPYPTQDAGGAVLG